MKTINRKINYVLVAVLLICLGCSDTNTSKAYFNDDKYRCKYSFDETGIKNGLYACFEGDVILEKGFMKDDSLFIDERVIYYPSGVIKEYRFYDILGYLRFKREYDEFGNTIQEDGDFFSHMIIPNSKVGLEDSFIVYLHIATPPKTNYKIYGVYGDKRSELDLNTTESFISRQILKVNKKGTFTFLFDIDFYDSVSKKVDIRSGEVVFDVE